jgi:hypothetical protein
LKTFSLKHFYTRRQISDQVGGDLQSYLPLKDGRVVCASLRSDLNPDEPKIILVGNKPKVKYSAELLCNQSSPIPLFIKRDKNKWEYIGLYKVEHFSDSIEDIAYHKKISGRQNLTRIIFLSPFQ